MICSVDSYKVLGTVDIDKAAVYLGEAPYKTIYIKKKEGLSLVSCGNLWRTIATDSLLGNCKFKYAESKEEAQRILNGSLNIHYVPVIKDQNVVCQFQDEYIVPTEFVNGVGLKLHNYNSKGVANVFEKFGIKEINLIDTGDSSSEIVDEVIGTISCLKIKKTSYEDFINDLNSNDDKVMWVDVGSDYYLRKLRRYIWGKSKSKNLFLFLKDFLNLVNTCCVSYVGINKYINNLKLTYGKICTYGLKEYHKDAQIIDITENTEVIYEPIKERYNISGPNMEITILANFTLFCADVPFYYNGRFIYNDNYYWNCEELLREWIEQINIDFFVPNDITLKLFQCDINKVLHYTNMTSVSGYRGNVDDGKDEYVDFIDFLGYEKNDGQQMWEEIYGISNKNVLMKDMVMGVADYAIERNPLQIENKCVNIHIFGCCLVNGVFVKDNDTLAAILKERYPECNVYSHGSLVVDLRETIQAYGRFQTRDIVLIMPTLITLVSPEHSAIETINIEESFFHIPDVYSCIWQVPLHCNHRIVREIGNLLSDKITRDVVENNKGDETGKKEVIISDYIIENELDKYLESLKQIQIENFEDRNNGAIVMNCNPYTYGHDYLISTASSQVDYLFIFVVEEDKSFFSFDQRYEMVRRNCKKYENVIVVPSGKYIISSITMPGYFDKENLQDTQLDASMDLNIFGSKICPVLHIVKRFVGAEPIDKFTSQYNENMKRILPRYGINVIEIDRLQKDGGVVSASAVRKLMKERKFDMVQSLVPKETFSYLKEIYRV